MPSKKPQIKTYTDEVTIKKFAYIANKDSRTMSKQLEYLVKTAIKEYESENGEIKIENYE